MTRPTEEVGFANCQEAYRCRITVVRKDFNADLYEQCPYGACCACGRFEVGQEFITSSRWDPASGFCGWAWGDIRPIIMSIHGGHKTPMIACCTDGLRPVFFKIELIPKEPEPAAI